MRKNSFSIDDSYQNEFMMKASRVNLQRGKFSAAIIISIELLLLLILFFNSHHEDFKYNSYVFMYVLMIVLTTAFRIVLSCLEKNIEKDIIFAKRTTLSITIYITFLMIWGAVISLMDQALYGNIIAFLVNMLFASFLFYIDSKLILIGQLTAASLLFIGLPYFQSSSNVLIGHYINISIFMIFAWIIARSNYNNYVQNFINQKLIEEKSLLLTRINENLINEIYAREEAQKELEEANLQLTAISNLDALTGIPNRRRMNELANLQWGRAVEGKVPIAIMMIDIDFFKLFNDTNGHMAGDSCLQAIAGVLNSCRKEDMDFVARYGGEEFLFIAVKISYQDTILLGEKIRSEVEKLRIAHHTSPISPYITASVGINWFIPSGINNLSDSLEQADRALYQAKQNGRNQVAIAV